MAEFTPADRSLIKKAAESYEKKDIQEMLRFARLGAHTWDISFWEEVLKLWRKNNEKEENS